MLKCGTAAEERKYRCIMFLSIALRDDERRERGRER
eukprot:COSAG02_NODE_9183_length_2299_cov_2.083182_3_plen_35_part_01